MDPGIVNVFSQYLYMIVFGLLGAFVFKPFHYIKHLFMRLFGNEKENKDLDDRSEEIEDR